MAVGADAYGHYGRTAPKKVVAMSHVVAHAQSLLELGFLHEMGVVAAAAAETHRHLSWRWQELLPGLAILR